MEIDRLKLEAFGIVPANARQSVMGITLDRMREQHMRLGMEFYNTPKWRRIKRHRLAYAMVTLAEGIQLLAHVLGEE